MLHQYVAIFAGSGFGSLCMMGGVTLWRRRIYNSRVRANSRFMDIFILNWFLDTLGIGLLAIPISLYHAVNGDTSLMAALTDWFQSVLVLNTEPEILAEVGFFYKLLLFPYSHFVHVWNVALDYMFRPCQIVRTKMVKS